MNKEIRLTTVCRLHFGFLDLNGDLGRKYGSSGLALEDPSFTLLMRPHDRLEIINGPKDRIGSCLRDLARHFNKEPLFRVELESKIPTHTGLGSGTQLALALGRAATALWEEEVSIRDLAVVVKRGRRSGVGVTAFEQGGFILDAGHNTEDLDKGRLPPTIMRHDFPEDWCFVVAIPQESQGLSGNKENDTLARLKPSRMISGDICRFVLMMLLPGLLEKDIKTFGCALTEIDRRTGHFFYAAQDGIYSEDGAEGIVGYMLEAGAYGAGQSSWGPAIYGLSTREQAPRIHRKVKDFFERKNIRAKVFISTPNNQGARMEILPLTSF